MTYKELNPYIREIEYEIFDNVQVNELNKIEIRKLVFSYFIECFEYDYEELKYEYSITDPLLKVANRNRQIKQLVTEKKGICNAIAQLYKLILDDLGVYVMCVDCVCDIHPHQLTFAENGDGYYSIDDPTMAIINKNDNPLNYFGYDYNKANQLKQGIKYVFNNQKWRPIKTNLIYFIFHRDDNDYQTYLRKKPVDIVDYKNEVELPSNIKNIQEYENIKNK